VSKEIKDNNNILKHPEVGPASVEYFISDFKINDLPDENPLMQVIEDFSSRR